MFTEAANFAQTFPWFFPMVATVFGACIGSFLNVVIYRMPAGKSVVTPASHCGCGRPIAWHDNIPILSWILLGGRARCCGRPFSIRYPAIELLTAILFLVCALKFGPGKAVCGMILVSALIAATFIDLDHFIIPDVFTLGLAVCGVILSILVPSLHGQDSGLFFVDSFRAATSSVVGLLIGSAVILWIGLFGEAILKKEAMGFGDVKFLGGIGAFLGWPGALVTIFLGTFVGLAWYLVAQLIGKMSGRSATSVLPAETAEGVATEHGDYAHIPFGPMLAIAAVIYFLGFDHWFLAYIEQTRAMF